MLLSSDICVKCVKKNADVPKHSLTIDTDVPFLNFQIVKYFDWKIDFKLLKKLKLIKETADFGVI